MKAKVSNPRKSSVIPIERTKPRRWPYVLAVVAAVIAAFWAYAPALSGPFLFDDTNLPYTLVPFKTASLWAMASVRLAPSPLPHLLRESSNRPGRPLLIPRPQCDHPPHRRKFGFSDCAPLARMVRAFARYRPAARPRQRSQSSGGVRSRHLSVASRADRIRCLHRRPVRIAQRDVPIDGVRRIPVSPTGRSDLDGGSRGIPAVPVSPLLRSKAPSPFRHSCCSPTFGGIRAYLYRASARIGSSICRWQLAQWSALSSSGSSS